MKQKKLGIIGGMGSKATSVFFERIVDSTDANKDQEHIDMVILNHATLPDRTAVIHENREEEFLNAIEKDIKLLEFAGVDNIAIPCNTSHYFYEKMTNMTDINIINMVEETVKKVHSRIGDKAKVGILATEGTLSTGVYEKVCNQYELDLYIPNKSIRQQTMKIIYDNVKNNSIIDSKELEQIIKRLLTEKKCECVIIACTELSCIKLSDDIAKYCIDAMDVLVEKAIELSGKKIKGGLR